MKDGPGRLILIGLDGATFQLLDPLLAEGLLPNLKSAIETGCRAILKSTIPPSTAPAWASCITGVNPGKHGLFDFRGPLQPGGKRPLVDARSIRAAKIWTILNHHGKRAGIINLPVSFPPEPLDGFMISGMMTPGPEAAYTFPPALRQRLGDYVLDIKSQAYEITSVADGERFLHDAWAMFDRRWHVSRRLMEEESWDFFMVVLVLLDRIQHRLWKYLDLGCELAHTPDGRQIRGIAHQFLARFDEKLGALLSNLPSDTSLIMVSDHGFGPLDAFFNVNRWLADLDMLTFQAGAYFKSRLFRAAVEIGARPVVRKLIPPSLDRRVREGIRRQRTLLKQSIEDRIDWAASSAYLASNLEQGIYLLGPPDRVGQCRDEIADRLRALTLPRDAKPLVDEVYFREDLFHGPWADQAAPLYIKCRNYTVLGNAQPGRQEWFSYLDDDPRGFHQQDGVLIALGPNFRAGHRLPAVNIVDVTPTVLYALGLPVPESMDGRVVADAFEPAFRQENPVSYEAGPPADLPPGPGAASFSEEEAESLSERLRALGYLG
jgi:predicted AlkP superfamily phosphohydrolase/phosphomutase